MYPHSVNYIHNIKINTQILSDWYIWTKSIIYQPYMYQILPISHQYLKHKSLKSKPYFRHLILWKIRKSGLWTPLPSLKTDYILNCGLFYFSPFLWFFFVCYPFTHCYFIYLFSMIDTCSPFFFGLNIHHSTEYFTSKDIFPAKLKMLEASTINPPNIIRIQNVWPIKLVCKWFFFWYRLNFETHLWRWF